MLLFVSSNWSTGECLTSRRRKKNDDVFCFLFNKETANVCPSFHPYCMTDWFLFSFADKTETPPRIIIIILRKKQIEKPAI